MNIDLNSYNVNGRLVRDPELGYTASNSDNNTPLCKFTIAVADGEKDGKDVVYFLDVTAWGKLAEAVNQYTSKGDRVTISGKLKQDTWRDKKTDTNRSKLSIVAHMVQFIETKKKDDQEEPYDPGFKNIDKDQATFKEDDPFSDNKE